MTENIRFYVQLAANILGVGFVIVIAFSQIADYVLDHKGHHIMAAAAWFALVPVLLLRTAAIFTPPRIDPQVIADGSTIGWAIVLLFGMAWGLSKLYERRKEAQARERLGLNDTKASVSNGS